MHTMKHNQIHPLFPVKLPHIIPLWLLLNFMSFVPS